MKLTPDERIVLRYLLAGLVYTNDDLLKDVEDCAGFRGLDREEAWRRADAALEALKRKILGDP